MDEGGVTPDLEEHSRLAGEMLERSLLRAVSSVEAELQQVVRTGEADLNRLAARIAETLAKLAIDSVFSGAGGDTGGGSGAASTNGLATAIARAARRGSRFA
jgi:phage-related minor tail protein